MTTLGVCLAGGRGVRLEAGVPKALVVCAGRTLLARAVATLEEACDAVVVVAPRELALPPVPCRRIDDPPDAEGPLAGLVAGLLSQVFDEALVLAVDLPLLAAGTLGALRALRGDAPAVLAAPGGIPQPLAAWYAPGAPAVLAAALAAGERSPTRAVLALGPTLVDDAALAALPGGLDAWLNVNTRADLAEAERVLAASAARAAK